MKKSNTLNRRHFNQLFLTSAIGTTLSTACQRLPGGANVDKTSNLLIPPRLKSGQRVGLIAPSSNADEDKIQKAHKNLESLGLIVEEGKYLREKNGFIGGTDGERVEEIHTMFRRKDIDAVWCVRGGYGATRLLPMLDYDLIRNHPKVFVGYSDITALHQAFLTQAGLVSYHGPVGSSEFSPYSLGCIQAALMGNDTRYEVTPAMQPAKGEESFQILHSGRATGQLVGGNLTLLASMCGTRYLPDFTGKIVFIEDIGEASYRIDRMLVQLIQAARLNQAAGLIFGNFTNCDPPEGSADQTVQEVIKDHFLAYDIPIVTGYSIGHIDQNATLAVGMTASLDADRGHISIGS